MDFIQDTCTSDLQAQLNNKQSSGSYLLTTGGTMTSNINKSGNYGLNWTNGGQISCYLGVMYFNLYGKNIFFNKQDLVR